MNNTWKHHERLENGEAVFIRESGEIAVEKDHRHLVDARPEELFEIFQKWPELLEECIESRKRCPAIARKYDGALKDQIIALEFEAAEKRSVIAALKLSNDERDKMIASLMDDIENYKAEKRTLWLEIEMQRETKKRLDGIIVELTEQRKDEEYSKK